MSEIKLSVQNALHASTGKMHMKIKGNRLTRSFVCLAVLTVNGWTVSACLAAAGAKLEPQYETFIHRRYSVDYPVNLFKISQELPKVARAGFAAHGIDGKSLLVVDAEEATNVEDGQVESFAELYTNATSAPDEVVLKSEKGDNWFAVWKAGSEADKRYSYTKVLLGREKPIPIKKSILLFYPSADFDYYQPIIARMSKTFQERGIFEPSLTSFSNSTYRLNEFYDKPIKLKNGKAEGQDKTQFPYGWLCRLEKAAVGDLDRDGTKDGAVVLGFNGGGSGYFVRLLAMLNRNGQMRQTAIRELGDRVEVTAVNIKNGVVTISMKDRTFEDGMADLTVRKTLAFELKNGKWRLISEKSIRVP
ncbi:MAG: hypothetical protein K2X77_11785 [Candidatus Obscuribacterales bacterium]|jgi:hypothetical protein|nr:hypothetical protein [Candidatus Obscuribacterales bacterium]